MIVWLVSWIFITLIIQLLHKQGGNKNMTDRKDMIKLKILVWALGIMTLIENVESLFLGAICVALWSYFVFIYEVPFRRNEG